MLSTMVALAILAVIPAATAVSDQFTPLRFNGDSPYCLDVAGGAIPAAGQPVGVMLWECNGQTNQGWRVEPVHRYIQSQLSPEGNFCLDRRDDYQFILSLCSEVQHHLTTLNDLINVGGTGCLSVIRTTDETGRVKEELTVRNCGDQPKWL